MANDNLVSWIGDELFDGVWIWDLESDENIWFSPKLKSLLGYTDQEAPNTKHWWRSIIVPDDIPKLPDTFVKTLQDFTHIYDRVLRHYHKNGTIVWLRCRGKIIFDNAHKPIRMIGVHNNVSEFKRSEQVLKRLTGELGDLFAAKQALFNAILDSIVVINQEGIIRDINASTESLFGYDRNELIGNNIEHLLERDEAERNHHRLSKYSIEGHTNLTDNGREVIACKKNGELFYAWLSLTKYESESEIGFVVTLRDISDQVKKRLNLEFAALYDDLTQIATRRLLEQHIEQAITESIRYGKQFSLLFIDLNKFKPINDTLGHDVGDEVLKMVAQRLTMSIRSGDLCARYGGDEFVVLCEPTTHRTDLRELIAKLKTSIQKPITIDGHDILLDSSIGIARFPEDGASKNALLRKADSRMYDEKRNMQK